MLRSNSTHVSFKLKVNQYTNYRVNQDNVLSTDKGKCGEWFFYGMSYTQNDSLVGDTTKELR